MVVLCVSVVQVWDLFYNANGVREMIKQKIQEESLRTYLFSYSSVYDSLSLDILASMFELDKAVVHSIVSKMIINEELMVKTLLHIYVQILGMIFCWIPYRIQCLRSGRTVQIQLDNVYATQDLHQECSLCI